MHVFSNAPMTTGPAIALVMKRRFSAWRASSTASASQSLRSMAVTLKSPAASFRTCWNSGEMSACARGASSNAATAATEAAPSLADSVMRIVTSLATAL